MPKKEEKTPIALFVLLFLLHVFITNPLPILTYSHASTVADQISTASTSSAVDAIAVWQHSETGTQDIWYSIWDDTNSQWWTTLGVQASPIAELSGSDADPNIAFDRQGNAIAVWSHETDNASLGYDIWYSQWSGYNWTSPAEVASLTGNDTDPAVAFDTSGWAIALWVHNKTYIYYSLWNGTNWIGPAQAIVSDWPLLPFWGSSLPEIVFTSGKARGYTSNNAVAIWTQWVIYPEVPPLLLSRIYYAIWDGTAWSPSPAQEIPGQLNNAARDKVSQAFRNGLSSDNLNNAIAVWSTENITQPIYYALWDGRIWSDATTLDIEEAYGYMPSIAFNADNDAILLFSHNTTNLWYSSYVSDVWQPATEATNSGGNDSRPSIAFLKNSKAVAIWSSDADAFAPSEIFYSVWNPSTGMWTTATNVVPQGLNGNDLNPSVASTSGSPTMPPASLPQTRDVAVVSVDPFKNIVAQGYLLSINVTVENQGTTAETFDVTAYVNTTVIGIQTVANLAAGVKETLIFNWNTTGFAYGNYALSAVAETIPGEVDTADNTFNDGIIAVTIPGDIDGDLDVDFDDFIVLAGAFGSSSGQPAYNLFADIDNDGDVDFDDFIILAGNYGKTI